MSKLTKAEEKRFDEKFGDYGISVDNPQMAMKNLFLGLGEYNKLIKQHLADEKAISRKEVVEEIKKMVIGKMEQESERTDIHYWRNKLRGEQLGKLNSLSKPKRI